MNRAPRIVSKSFDSPDSLRPLGRGTGVFVDLSGMAIGRAVLEPGWRWSVDVKPLVGTPSCQVHHLQLVLAGRMGIRMDDGDEHEFGPADVIDIPPGHDAWVVGEESLVLVDMSGNVSDFALPASQARSVVTMLMTDIVDSTRTAAQLGDAAWKQRLGDHNRIVRHQLERFGGREVDTTGDGFLVIFGSAEAALRAALAICENVRSIGLEVRTGVHTGEVEVLDGDVRGLAVHETARIMSAAPSGSVYASPVTRALAAASNLRFASTGTHALKGFDEPVELFKVESAA